MTSTVLPKGAPPVLTTFRAATAADSPTIARLFQMASDGVVDYVWQTLQPQYPGLTPLQIGAIRYADPDNSFGYKNCVIAEQNGDGVGMMVSFPIEPSSSESASSASELNPETATDAADKSSVVSSDENFEAESLEPDVLAPYQLEAPNTWYICALAVFPAFRGQGIGSQFLQIAHQQAAQNDFAELSLLCFEQNGGARRLYERNGFTTVDRTAVVPHHLIHYTGDLLLMTAPVHA